MRRHVWACVALLLFLLLLGWLTLSAPPWRMDRPVAAGRELLAADGRPFARLGGVAGGPVDAEKLPRHVREAFLAIEDRRFPVHYGIDAAGILRAAWRNFRAGTVVEGGSTITQQYVKTVYLGNDRTFGRKFREFLLAPWVEAWMSKDRILSAYLSTVYFGDGAYGLAAASRHYFDRSPDALSLDQAAMLAGLVKAPSRLAPTRDPGAAAERTRVVLRAMADAGYITPERAAERPDIRLSIGDRPIPGAGYFADWIAERLGKAEAAGAIPTTLEPALQARAAAVLARARLGGAQAALVAMRPDGSVVAMMGGRDYARSTFDRAVHAQRQPGSTFKLFVYLAALRDGAEPDMYVDDLPLDVGGWRPANADGMYRGPVTLHDAFADSSNVAAVRVFQIVGRDNVVRMARDLGITSPLPAGPSMALGTGTMTLMELTAAYAAVAEGRYPIRPFGMGAAPAGPQRNFDSDRERQPMLDMLWEAANTGTGQQAALAEPTFGKTGTTQDNRDAWFVGFAGDYVTGVWVGRDDNKPVPGLSGGRLAAAIWRDFMAGATTMAIPERAPLPTRIPEQAGASEKPASIAIPTFLRAPAPQQR